MGGWLSQNRQIPRSPDGDRNICHNFENLIWGKNISDKMREAGFCEYAVVLYFTNFCLTMLNVCSANIYQQFFHSKLAIFMNYSIILRPNGLKGGKGKK